jgi:hypothetical protein
MLSCLDAQAVSFGQKCCLHLLGFIPCNILATVMLSAPLFSSGFPFYILSAD